MKKTICNLLFSPIILRSAKTQKIAYVGLMTALSIVCNMFFEIKFYDIQFSLTIAVSCIIGALIGSTFGFVSCFVGDLIGFFINSWGQLYMPWVGLSTAIIAFISGVVINGINFKFRGNILVKILIVSILTFLVCSIGINSTGFYFYNLKMGFSTAVIDYVNETFGSGVGYSGYIAYRMIFKGQIFNSLVNYALLFIVLPLILKNKFLRGGEINEDRTK